MKIRYFAWLKDKIGTAEEDIILPGEVIDVGTLISWLSSREQRYADAFEFAETIRVAVNDKYAGYDHPVEQDDEVAFIPPIAGG